MQNNVIRKEVDNILLTHPNLLSEIKEEAAYTDNSKDRALINKNNGSSVVIRENGDISISPSSLSQIKGTADGHIIEQAIETNSTTVRKNINTDELIVNNHKFNPMFYELTDMRAINETNAIGNLTVNTTVLVKAWEHTLQKWVLIRRPARIPMFSPVLNLANAPEQLSINSDISEEIELASVSGRKK